jgi:hypothetical protein
MASASAPDKAPPALGQLVRLRVLKPSELPRHATLAPAQDKQPQASNGVPEGTSLASFITQALTEGVAFIDKTIPHTFTKTGSKASPPSAAHVTSSKRKISSGDILNGIGEGNKWGFAQAWRDEFWFARRSVHTQGEEAGTAPWKEFVDGLLRNHSVHEAEYTPNVFDSRKICDWDEELGSVPLEGFEEVRMCSKWFQSLEINRLSGRSSSRWGDREDILLICEYLVYEMSHYIPFPLFNRTFPTLVISAIDSSKTGTDSFIVVQVPVDLTAVPTAFYSTGKNRKEGSTSRQKKKVVLGQYVSVERCKVIKEDGSEDHGKVLWEMATASDAKGWLPMALQKLGVPGAVVKDVGFFIKWTTGRRGRGEPKVTSGGAAS